MSYVDGVRKHWTKAAPIACRTMTEAEVTALLARFSDDTTNQNIQRLSDLYDSPYPDAWANEFREADSVARSIIEDAWSKELHRRKTEPFQECLPF